MGKSTTMSSYCMTFFSLSCLRAAGRSRSDAKPGGAGYSGAVIAASGSRWHVFPAFRPAGPALELPVPRRGGNAPPPLTKNTERKRDIMAADTT